MQDAWRAYLELALGVTEASRKKATQVIKSLTEQSGAKIDDVQGMAEELFATGMANRENVVKLIRFELDRALGKVGLATNEEVGELTSRVQQLEIQLREARSKAEAAEAAAAAAQATVAAEPKAKTAAASKPVKKTAAKKSAAKKATARKAVKKVAKKATKPAGGGR